MYPRVSDFIYDVFGVQIPIPIQSYGLFVALAFIIAGYFLYLELKRKTKEGLLLPSKRKVLVGEKAKPKELIIAGIIGFLLGFKLLGIILNYTYFYDDPQSYILSSEGNFIGGLLGCAISVYLSWHDKQKNKLDKPKWVEEIVQPYELTSSIIVIGVIASIIGAKIFHNLENIDEFLRDPVDALISFSGLTFYGGLIVCSITLIWYGKKNGIPPKVLVDAAAPAVMLGYAIGRIGCQVSGDGDWGIENLMPKPEWLSFLPDWMWAYNFPNNVLNEGIPIEGCVGKYCSVLPNPVFPTAFYETTICFIFFLILWAIRKRFKTHGLLFSVYLVMNGTERFFIEKIRVNEVYHILGFEITQAEIISTILFLIGLTGIIYFKFINKKKD
ncbi:MAG: prolipoprotein diacylglyceryl transferase [Bacteroidales bacterium]|nr:prolipoprotein diacylglyceryl transferase [Bacteroidales bacterium]